MKYAQIKNGKVVNVIAVDENSPMDTLAEGYDSFLRIDQMIPIPAMGSSYDGVTFTPPPKPKKRIIPE